MKTNCLSQPLLCACLLTLLSSLLLPLGLRGQNRIKITVEEAIEIAKRNYPLLKRDRLAIERQQVLLATARSHSTTNLYLAGSQIDPEQPAGGIHGGGVFQAFNWPGYKKYQRDALQSEVLLENARLELTDWQLRQEVAKAYYQLVYTQQLRAYYQKKQELMSNLVKLAEDRFELGETGKVPVLSATSKQKQASLEQREAQKAYDLALTLFNNWLYSDSVFQTKDNVLRIPSASPNWYVNGGHPMLLVAQQEVRAAEASVVQSRSHLLPKILAGGQVQMINEELPFIGYQLGLSVPIGRKSLQARIEGAERSVAVRQAELDATQRALENRRRELTVQLKAQQDLLDYISEELLPLADEQISAAEKAYEQGAVGYHDYLVNLEQGLQSQLQWVEALRDYHMVRLELEFLSGRR